jgi:hypothetical protein
LIPVRVAGNQAEAPQGVGAFRPTPQKGGDILTAHVKHLGFESHRHSKGNPVAAVKRHIRYIEEDKEHHRNTPQLFNEETDFVRRREVYQKLNKLPKRGVVAHKLIFTLSEEERRRGKIDLKELVRESMLSYQIQNKIGLDWVGSIHDDEGHPHAHVVVLGRDSEGRQVGFYKKHLKQIQQIAEHQRERLAARNLQQERSLDDLLHDLEQERTMERTNERTLEWGLER